MKGSELIEKIQELHLEDHDFDKWMVHRIKTGINTLNFMDSGKAIRILLKILGKPKQNYNVDQSGKKLNCRVVVWSLWDKIDKQIEASEALEAAGITEFNITPSQYFIIHIPRDVFFSAFTTSDDPQEWERQQLYWQGRTDANKQRKIQKQLEKQKEWDDQCEANRERYEQEAKEREEQKRQEELLKEMGKRALQREQELNRIQVDDVTTNTRAIKVEGGD